MKTLQGIGLVKGSVRENVMFPPDAVHRGECADSFWLERGVKPEICPKRGWRLGGVGTFGVVACVQEVAVTPGELLG